MSLKRIPQGPKARYGRLITYYVIAELREDRKKKKRVLYIALPAIQANKEGGILWKSAVNASDQELTHQIRITGQLLEDNALPQKAAEELLDLLYLEIQSRVSNA